MHSVGVGILSRICAKRLLPALTVTHGGNVARVALLDERKVLYMVGFF